MDDNPYEDLVVACIDLVGRCGSSGMEMGFLNDNVPIEQADWWARANFKGLRITVEHQSNPGTAALALAQRLLRGATCRCTRQVSLSGTGNGCRWSLVGQRWEPGCTAQPMRLEGERGDLKAINEAVNRAARLKGGRR